jgi:hypothetical protein
MLSSDEDEYGRIKKHKQPFSPQKKCTFDFKGKLVNVYDPVIPKSVNQMIEPKLKVKDFVDDGSVYTDGQSVAASGRKSKAQSGITTPAIKLKKAKSTLDDKITTKDVKLNENFLASGKDPYKNISKTYEEDLNVYYCSSEALRRQ